MPTPESERVQAHRDKYFEQQPILVERGGRDLLKVLATMRGNNVSETLRKGALHDAGLNYWPYPADAEAIAAVDLDDRQQVERAVRHLQNRERVQDPEVFNELADDPLDAVFTTEVDPEDAHDLYRLCRSICRDISAQRRAAPDPLTSTTTLTMTGGQLAALRRFIANREQDLKSVR